MTDLHSICKMFIANMKFRTHRKGYCLQLVNLLMCKLQDLRYIHSKIPYLLTQFHNYDYLWNVVFSYKT